MHKVGIIGLGYWGPKLAHNFHELLDAKLEWGCDLDQPHLDHIGGLYPEVRTSWSFADKKAPSSWLTLAAPRILRRAEAG